MSSIKSDPNHDNVIESESVLSFSSHSFDNVEHVDNDDIPQDADIVFGDQCDHDQIMRQQGPIETIIGCQNKRINHLGASNISTFVQGNHDVSQIRMHTVNDDLSYCSREEVETKKSKSTFKNESEQLNSHNHCEQMMKLTMPPSNITASSCPPSRTSPIPQHAKDLISLFDSPVKSKDPPPPVDKMNGSSNSKQRMDYLPHPPLYEAFEKQKTERTFNFQRRKNSFQNEKNQVRREIFHEKSLHYNDYRDSQDHDETGETDHLLNGAQSPQNFYTNQGNQYLESLFNKDERSNIHVNKHSTNTNESRTRQKYNSSWSFPKSDYIFNTIVSSIIYGLFQIVFCLALASTISRPYSNRPVIGQMVRVAAMGPVLTTPVYIYYLVGSFPDLYPSIDTFAAPFAAQQALIIDQVLTQDGLAHDDNLFLTTFCVVSGIGLCLTGLFLVLATQFKLANLGAFLPYPVMSGFFSAVGLLVWTLAFSVDTGKHVSEVFLSPASSWSVIKSAISHHCGSIIVAIVMTKVGAIHTSLVPVVTLLTIPGAYLVLYATGMTLEDARRMGWFWYTSAFESSEASTQWEPPLPFGVVMGIFHRNVHWGAVWKALPVTLAMAIIYFIRCSLHAPALKKSTANLQKYREDQEGGIASPKTVNRRSVLFGRLDSDDNIDTFDDCSESSFAAEKAKFLTMSEVYLVYGKILWLLSIFGSLPCVPSIGPSSTIVKLGATGSGPQYGSVLVLLAFYLTNFELLGYIPKITFSSLLVLTAFNMTQDWFFNSYVKIKQKGEWFVVPLIVILTFTVGSLVSVFVGIAISTFIFVGAFYRSGVVKYIANGLTVHSTTERNPDVSNWLDIHGDLIQLVVLQNYLFFGNAYSCFNYVNTMFEDPSPSDIEKAEFELPPVPKFLVIDFTLVTGIDVSAVDVFSDIVSLCKENNCKMFLSGLRPEFMSVFQCGGVQPSNDKKSANFALSFLSDMDSALRKAEDALVKKILKDEETEMMRRASNRRIGITIEGGFISALEQIDSQVSLHHNYAMLDMVLVLNCKYATNFLISAKHNMSVTSKLSNLSSYTTTVTLQRGEVLVDHSRGLFFIEHGIMVSGNWWSPLFAYSFFSSDDTIHFLM